MSVRASAGGLTAARRTKSKASEFMDHASALFSAGEGYAAAKTDGTRAGQASTVQAAITIGVLTLVGIVILGKTYNLVPDTGNSVANNTSENVFEGILDSFGFVPLIVLVLFAVVVMGAVSRFR